MNSRVIVVCGTVVIVTLVAAVTLLEAIGRDMQIRALLLLVGPYLSGFLTIVATEWKARQTRTEVIAAKDEIVSTVNGAAHTGNGGT